MSNSPKNPAPDDSLGFSADIAALSDRAEDLNTLADALLTDVEGQIGEDDFEVLPTRETPISEVGDDKTDDVDLLTLLSPETQRRYQQWLDTQAIPWTSADVVPVGAAVVLGSLMAALDDVVDSATLNGLTWLRETPVLEGWEELGRRLPIDYTGRHFGGPDHRQRSAGHDVVRLMTGVRQIRAGVFEGVFWEDGVKKTFATALGAYTPEESYVTALAKLLAHLGADFVTPMSLPLPGWTFLGSLPPRKLRLFAADLYRARYNMRSGMLAPSIGVAAVGFLLRSHAAASAYDARGSIALQGSEHAKLDEMLLVGHSGLAAASVSKAAARAFCGEGAIALRHLSGPAFARAGVAAVVVVGNRSQGKKLAPPTWEDLAWQTLQWQDLNP